MINEEKMLRDIYSKIDTPEYDATNDVMRRLHSAPRKNIALRRVIIIAAVLCLCGVALGAAQIIGWQSFNLFGEKTGSGSPILPAITVPPGYESEGYTPIKRTTPEPEDPEVVEYQMRFMDETADDEVRLSFTNHGNGYGGGSNSGMETDDFTKIENIMANCISPIKIPAYIPEGYVFKEGEIDFYVDEDSLPKLTYFENKNGKAYLIYKHKDGFEKKVSKIELTYADKKGDELRYSLNLCQFLADNIQHQVSESAVVKTIEISGFDEGIWIYDKKNKFHLNRLALFKEIAPIDAVDLYSASLRDIIEPDNEWAPDIMKKDTKYISVVCHIYADSLDVEELIKIAESIH